MLFQINLRRHKNVKKKILTSTPSLEGMAGTRISNNDKQEHGSHLVLTIISQKSRLRLRKAE